MVGQNNRAAEQETDCLFPLRRQEAERRGEKSPRQDLVPPGTEEMPQLLRALAPTLGESQQLATPAAGDLPTVFWPPATPATGLHRHLHSGMHALANTPHTLIHTQLHFFKMSF